MSPAAARYHQLASERKFVEIQGTLYHEDVVCQEPDKATSMGMPSLPIVAGEFFSIVLKQEVTFKGKPRMAFEEIGVFQVNDGKIVKEQFFY